MTNIINWNKKRYVLDTSVFIAAHRVYYAPDFCPGFWECLIHYCEEGQVMSIDRVKDEILYPPELALWANEAPESLFLASHDDSVIGAFHEIMTWVEDSQKFKDSAVREFARGADGWLIAYAKINEAVVVTNEVYEPDIQKKVKIPNVCLEFNVEYQNTFEMLRELGVKFDWRKN